MIKKPLLVGFLAILMGLPGLQAVVPADQEGFTRYVLHKFEEKIPGHEFVYVAPLHFRDNKKGYDAAADEHLAPLFYRVAANPADADSLIDRYVDRAASAVASLKRWDEKATAQGDRVLTLPELGLGDPRLMICLGKNLIDFTLWTYTGDKFAREDYGYGQANDNEWRHLKLLYSTAHASDILVGNGLLHCYPYGEGKGFLRDREREDDGTVHDGPFILFAVQERRIAAKALNEQIVNQEFALAGSSRFLGKLDGIIFYRNQGDEKNIFGRDAKTGTVYRWKPREVYLIRGVLRGIKKRYRFVVYQKAWYALSKGTGELTEIEVSLDDAVIDQPGK